MILSFRFTHIYTFLTFLPLLANRKFYKCQIQIITVPQIFNNFFLIKIGNYVINMKKMTYIIIGVFILSLLVMVPSAMAQDETPIFRRSFWGNPVTLDAQNSWDSASNDIIDQVQESLVAYDLYDPSMAIVTQLATDLGTLSTNGLEWTFNLRQGVTWHDGTPFNATCVKFSFDRLAHLIEIDESILGELYEPLAQLYPDTPLVINETVVVSNYVVKFVLNYPYGAFLNLLCYTGSDIVHWNYPAETTIEMDATYLIGTGPYVLEEFEETEYTFMAYEDYYLPQPDIQEMHWIKYADMITENQAFLAGDVDAISSLNSDYLATYEADTENFWVAPPLRGTSIYYFGLNNQLINKTWRQALSYATDYEYLIRYIMNDQVVRMTSVIPVGILYHDPAVVPANFDLDRARTILAEAGLSRGLTAASPDVLWYAIADSEDPLASFNFSYNAGNNRRADMGLMLKNNLKLIGVDLDVYALDWAIYNNILNYHPERLSIYNIGWGADYNDPSNFINPLFSNTSYSNSAQVNDAELQNAMMAALQMTNVTERIAAYSDIQHYIMEDLMPWIFLYVPYSKAVYSVHVSSPSRNPMGKVYFYPYGWYHVSETSSTTPTPPPAIPGYSFIALLGAAAVTVGVLLYKRRR